MRQLLYRAGFVIAIEIMVSVLLVLCANAIINENKTYLPMAQLNDNYVLFFPSTEQKNTLKNIGSKLPKEMRYAGFRFQKGSAVTLQDNISLEEGRTFTKEDQETKANVVLLRKDLLPLCKKVKDKRFYMLYGTMYEVIGVYSDGERNDSRSNEYLVNLYAEGISHQEDWEYGFLDAKESVQKSFLESLMEEGYTFAVGEQKREYFNRNVQTSTKAALAIYGGVAVIVFVNIFSAIAVWIRGRRKEIVIRKMVGAGKRQIFGWLVKDFMILDGISFFVGAVIAGGLLALLAKYEFSPSWIVVFGRRLEPSAIGLAFIPVVMIGLIVICIKVRWYLRHEIIQMIRSE
ncbi:MAG: hypothetical protein PUG66_03195 [Clostridiales bacterium]|nr:hypothetical protein [Eubacterium sp.]MDD7348848.1 hypothetical protein [Clostridiales bacterium]MDY3774181.1 FtsX-like permease family protein [Eubacterium sp.]